MSQFAVAVARARNASVRARKVAARLIAERSPDQEALSALLDSASGIEAMLGILASQDAAVLARELYSGEG